MATDDDDAATLRERVRDLEQTVQQQQSTIEQLMPSRRAILAGGAGLVSGVALTGQASAQSAAGQVGTSSEPVDVEAAAVTADSVSTDQASITDETDVEAIIAGSSNQSYQTGNGMVTVDLKNNTQDTRNEFDTSSKQFTPDNTGRYHIDFALNVQHHSENDRLRARLVNVTDGSTVLETDQGASGAARHNLGQSATKELIAGKNYELQFSNNNNDCIIERKEKHTYLTIRSAFN